MIRRPTLLDGCARAATAAEARFRIDSPLPTIQARVFALDKGAALALREVASRGWGGARFYLVDQAAGERNGNEAQQVALTDLHGEPADLAKLLEGADVAVMVLTNSDGLRAAGVIGEECARRALMTAGLVLGPCGALDAAVSSLRPHARVTIVSEDAGDISEVLSALRA